MTSISAIGAGVTAIAPAPTPSATSQTLQPQLSDDTVSLSEFAQVSQLQLQGQSPSEIADELGISVSTVDSYLAVVATSVTPTPAAAPTTASTKSTSAA